MTPSSALRRAAFMAALVAASALALLAVTLLIASWNLAQHWAAVHTGTVPVLCGRSPCADQPYYGFWSGFGSDLGEATLVTTMAAAAIHHARAVNCEQHRCWRVALHTLESGHRVCRRHGRAIRGGPLTHEHLRAAHEAALERRARAESHAAPSA